MTGKDLARRVAEARVKLVEAADRCAEAAAKLDPGRLPDFGLDVPDALVDLDAALKAGGDVPGIEEAARGLAAAVTAGVGDVPRGDSPGLAYIGSVLTLRGRLSVLDNAAADCETGGHQREAEDAR